MSEQVELLKEVTGDPSPTMRTTLYAEKSVLFAQGHLQPPLEPTLIWNFVAARLEDNQRIEKRPRLDYKRRRHSLQYTL